jgi:mannose-6-phosphate isomerase-like protein (cupin superfamily)
MSSAPILKHLDDLGAYRISPGDSVKLACLAGPEEGSPTSVFFEIWDPRGSQPDNSHPDSVEIFIFLAGHGRAFSDEHSVEVGPGDVLVLPVGSVHRIENLSDTERMSAVTIMAKDLGALEGGFAKLVANGTPVELEESDMAVLPRARP